jgi:TRAP-type C4-dicarboxylate transport system permease small subunit
MRSFAAAIDRLADALCRAACWLLLGLGVVMSVIVLLQVFFRFVIYMPFPWSEEIARYLMIWVGMIGSFVALRKGRHIGVTFLMERIPAAVARVLNPLIQIVLVGFLAVIAAQGGKLAVLNATQKSPAMMIPMIYPYLAIPVGAALMILEMTAVLMKDLFAPPAPQPGAGGPDRQREFP